MTGHPSSFQLEAAFVGEADPHVATHVQTCLQCRRALDELETARSSLLATESASAFLARPAIQAALVEAPVAPSDKVVSLWAANRRRIAGVAMALAAGVAAVALLPRTDNRSPEAASDTVRMKGVPVQLVVVRKRAADVTRHFGQVSIRAGDKLQIELTTSAAQRLTVGVLNEDGTWLPLTTNEAFAAGRHPIGTHALEVDDAPAPGWFIVGTAAAVAASRAAVEPRGGVLACRIHVEAGS